MNETPDAELLRLAKAGDARASEAMRERLAPGVRRFVSRYVPDPMTGQEIVQDVLLALHMNLDRMEEPSQVKPFVFRVARNLCWDELRRLGRELPLCDRLDGAARPARCPREAPDEAVYWLLVWDEVRRAVDCLAEPHRATLLLLAEAGLTHEQIADAMSTNVGTVKSRVHNARKQLVRLLRPETRGALGLGTEEEDSNGGTG